MNEDLTIDLSVLTQEPAEEYHAKAGAFLSSHQLADFMRSPLLYWRKRRGLVTEDGERPAYLLGRAAHTRILEGRDTYLSAFAIGGPVNPKTGQPFGAGTKAFSEWAEAQGKPVLTEDQANLIEAMAAGVALNAEAVDLLSYGEAERVARAYYGNIACQARFDWVHPHRGIVDLKTCDDLNYFEADARRYSYQRQVAFYRSMLALVHEGLVAPVYFVAVEKKEPFACGVWRVGEDSLAVAQQENEAAIRRLLDCRCKDRWPSGYEQVRCM